MGIYSEDRKWFSTVHVIFSVLFRSISNCLGQLLSVIWIAMSPACGMSFFDKYSFYRQSDHGFSCCSKPIIDDYGDSLTCGVMFWRWLLLVVLRSIYTAYFLSCSHLVAICSDRRGSSFSMVSTKPPLFIMTTVPFQATTPYLTF